MIRAVFGGSFDPVHDGHLAMARAVLAAGLADRVCVVVAGRSPHKPSPAAAGAHRLAMVRLAFADWPAVDIADLELRRRGPSYTVDTLEALAAAHPGDVLRLVLGADQYRALPDWRRPERVRELAEPIVLARGGDRAAPGAVHVLADFDAPVSSSAIRAMLAEGRRPDGLVPPPVARYIASHRLYQG